MHYIAALLDDIARVLPFANPTTHDLTWFHIASVSRCDSFAAAVRLAKPGKPLSYLCDVFERIYDDNSWWSLAFKYGVGSRQRVVHYTDWTAVDLAPLPLDVLTHDSEGWAPLTPPPITQIYITNPGDNSAIDFGDRLRLILSGLCEWHRSLSFQSLTLGCPRDYSRQMTTSIFPCAPPPTKHSERLFVCTKVALRCTSGLGRKRHLKFFGSGR